MDSTKFGGAQHLLDNLGLGTISKSYYDMSWVLRSGALCKEDELVLQKKILENQYPDGSWGAEFPYIHDRVINTLSVIVALTEYGGGESQIRRALEYLNKNIPKLLEEKVETIAFELTFLALLEEAKNCKINLSIENDAVRYYSKIGAQKKELLHSFILKKPTTALHSLEALTEVDCRQISGNLIFENGSIGNSPAATAFYVKKIGPQNAKKSVQYLNAFKSMNWDVPSIYPFEVFEKAWVLYNFLHAGILHKVDYKKQTDYLWNHWQKFGGASISNSFPIIDSDDTAVVYTVLKETGYPVDCGVFKQFEQEKWFRCFDLERNPSISANIHIYEALKTDNSDNRDFALQKIVLFLEGALDSTWVDKWNVSPFYTASHLVLAIREKRENLLMKALNFLKETQNQDGGWGVNISTAEETLNVMLALRRFNTEIDQDQINRVRAFLSKISQNNMEMWVDKGLYAPLSVIESLRLSF